MAFTSLSSKPVERAAYAIQSESHEKYFCRRSTRLRFTFLYRSTLSDFEPGAGISMSKRVGSLMELLLWTRAMVPYVRLCTLIVFVEEHDSLGYHWILTKPLAPKPFEHAHYVIENCVLDMGAWINTLGTDCTSETETVEEIRRG